MTNTGIPEEELEKFFDLPFDEKETRFIQPVALKHLNLGTALSNKRRLIGCG